MRYLPIAGLLTLAVGLSAAPTVSDSPIELTWKLKEDVFGQNGRDVSRLVFTLTNRGTTPLPARGWAVYYTALHYPNEGTTTGAFQIENVTGSLHRIVPAPDFQGLAPGRNAEVEYRTDLLTNNSFAPNGVYAVFDEAPLQPRAVDYTAVPFERAPQPGRDPHVITPEAQFELDAVVHDVPRESLPPVFPTPVSVEKREGSLGLAALPAIAAGPELQNEAALATEYLKPMFATPKAGSTPSGAAPGIRLEVGKVEGQPSPEAYELVVDPTQGVRIVGNSPAGAFYGLQSLRGLLPVAPGPAPGPAKTTARAVPVTLPALRVVDAPRFAHRGLMLDVARNFQPKAQVLRVLDLMARYKLNVLHFHVTEDEAWRVEMPSLPELTAVGARRGHTLDSSDRLPPAFGSGGDVANPYGSGFYSPADYGEILRYAAARHIEVIPEFEMPGHARAAIKSMEARARRLRAKGDAAAGQYLLNDPEDTSVYTSAQGYHDNVMNPALPTTYAFIARVVADLVDLHKAAGVPLRNLHLGGDEVPSGVWERSPAVAAYMKEHGLSSVDDLWYVFYGRVEEIVKAHGIVPSGWEDIGLRKTQLDGRQKMIPNPAFASRGWTTYVWNNAIGGGAEDLAYRMANAGYEVVLCPVSNNYIDMAWNKNPEEPGLDWGGYVDLRKPYEFMPFDYYRSTRYDFRGNPVDRALFVGKDRLTAYGRSNIVGLQAALWSETLGGPGRLDYKLAPALLAVAERAWAPEPEWAKEQDQAKSDALFRDAYSAFANVVGKRELPRLDRETPAWNYRIPKPGLKVDGGQVRTSLEIPGFLLRYTTDGTEPTGRSLEVRGPLPASAQLRVAAFDTGGRKGGTARLTAP